jgi:hypothetical protein
MLIIGALVRLADEYLSARRYDPITAGIYAIGAPALVLGLESSIPVGFAGTIKLILFLALTVGAIGWVAPATRLRFSANPARGEA